MFRQERRGGGESGKGAKVRKLTFRALALRQSESYDEGLTLETSAFNLFTVANLPYQLS